MVKYPPTPPKDFSWLGRPAPVPAPPPVQAPPTPAPPPVQVKEEVPDQEDSFDCFPKGAEPFSRVELFERMRSRGGVQGPAAPVQDTPDSFDQFRADVAHSSTPRPRGTAERTPATDFSALMRQENPQAPLRVPKQEPIAQDVQEGPAPGFFTPGNTVQGPPAAQNPLQFDGPTEAMIQALNAENAQRMAQGVVLQEDLALPTTNVPAAPGPPMAVEPTVESAMMNAIHQLMHSKDAMEVNIRRTTEGITLSVVKTPEKEAAQPAVENAVQEIPDSQASSVVSRPKRRLRVVDPSDDEQSDGEEDEEELPETEPESDGDVENDPDVTPTKKSKGPQTQITPSPAKRLRTLNLNIQESDDEEEEDETAGIDDSQAEENPFNDSYRDPEYIPDTQEMRDRPSDFRVPRNAVHDPLDLEY